MSEIKVYFPVDKNWFDNMQTNSLFNMIYMENFASEVVKTFSFLLIFGYKSNKIHNSLFCLKIIQRGSEWFFFLIVYIN